MRRIALILSLVAAAPAPGCQSSRSRPPSDVSAIRRPTLWDHLLSDREDEREAIASRLKAEESSLRGRQVGLLRSLREHELEAQLSADAGERSRHETALAELSRQVETNEADLDWVASKQQQNRHDWRYWPDRTQYRRPAASAVTPIVEAPTRNDLNPTASR